MSSKILPFSDGPNKRTHLVTLPYSFDLTF